MTVSASPEPLRAYSYTAAALGKLGAELKPEAHVPACRIQSWHKLSFILMVAGHA